MWHLYRAFYFPSRYNKRQRHCDILPWKRPVIKPPYYAAITRLNHNLFKLKILIKIWCGTKSRIKWVGACLAGKSMVSPARSPWKSKKIWIQKSAVAREYQFKMRAPWTRRINKEIVYVGTLDHSEVFECDVNFCSFSFLFITRRTFKICFKWELRNLLFYYLDFTHIIPSTKYTVH